MTRSQSKGQSETTPEGPAETHEQPLPPEIQPFLHIYAADEDFRAFVAGESDILPRRMTEDWIVGTPDAVEARLRAYTAEGIGHFLFWIMMDAASNARAAALNRTHSSFRHGPGSDG